MKKAPKKILFCMLLVVNMFTSCKNDCIDIDGNVYKTVKIGNQIWMSENLHTTRYRNGDSIPNVTGNSDWKNLSSGAFCYFDNTVNSIYGKLYNWYAVSDTRNIAPAGWHIPSDDEWSTLTNFLGGNDFASGKMKETGTMHWISPNSGATNESGFTALPAGFRHGCDGRFDALGTTGNFWSKTEFDSICAWDCRLLYNNASSHHANIDKRYGFPVRCVKD
jgi:uncharacterized protein (TIGR02145 family)